MYVINTSPLPSPHIRPLHLLYKSGYSISSSSRPYSLFFFLMSSLLSFLLSSRLIIILHTPPPSYPLTLIPFLSFLPLLFPSFRFSSCIPPPIFPFILSFHSLLSITTDVSVGSNTTMKESGMDGGEGDAEIRVGGRRTEGKGLRKGRMRWKRCEEREEREEGERGRREIFYGWGRREGGDRGGEDVGRRKMMKYEKGMSRFFFLGGGREEKEDGFDDKEENE